MLSDVFRNPLGSSNRHQEDNSRAENLFERPGRCLLHHFLISHPNRRKINPNACPDGLWWLRGALCLTMRALGEQFGVVETPRGPRRGSMVPT